MTEGNGGGVQQTFSQEAEERGMGYLGAGVVRLGSRFQLPNSLADIHFLPAAFSQVQPDPVKESAVIPDMLFRVIWGQEWSGWGTAEPGFRRMVFSVRILMSWCFASGFVQALTAGTGILG